MDKNTKLNLWMGNQTTEYKEKLEAIGEKLKAAGIDVEDKRKGGISISAVVRYLVDEKLKTTNS